MDLQLHIPDSEIQSDMNDTLREIADKQETLDILRRNPQENRVQIYLAEGYISKRERFVKQLQDLLEERSKII